MPSFKNGIILIKADESQVDEWMEQAKEGTFHLNVDLEEQTISDGTKQIPFDIPSYHKEKLLNGWDDIALTLLLDDKIREYEEKQAAKA